MHQLQHSNTASSSGVILPLIRILIHVNERQLNKSCFIILYLLFSISILWRRVWHHRTLPWVRQEKSSRVEYRGVAVTRDTWAGTWATATKSVWICCLDPEDETGLKWKSNRTPADVSPLVWMDHGVTLDTRAAYLLATCHTGTGTMIRFFYCSENVNKHVICAGSEGDNWEWGTIIMRSNMMTTIR